MAGRIKVQTVTYLQQVVQWVLPSLSEELLLNSDERSFSETLKTDHHP